MNNNETILKQFENIKIDPSWTFSGTSRKETAYLTHGYHRYPAKFIPQIVSQLVEKYTRMMLRGNAKFYELKYN